MTDPVQPSANAVPTTTSTVPPAPQAKPAAPQPDPFTVEVSRAAAAPVYVYRITDTATGRVLVEIPNDPAKAAADAPGRTLDARV